MLSAPCWLTFSPGETCKLFHLQGNIFCSKPALDQDRNASGLLVALQPPLNHRRRRCSKGDSRDLVFSILPTVCILPLLIQIPDLRRQRQHGSVLSLDRRARSVETASSLAFESIDGNAVEVRKVELDRKSTRLNSSHSGESRMPSSA